VVGTLDDIRALLSSRRILRSALDGPRHD
jgi:hypothetical protein